METVLIHPKNKEQLAAIKAFAKALKMEFETKIEESPYNPEFVKKIQQGDKDMQRGKGRTVTLEELDSLWK